MQRFKKRVERLEAKKIPLPQLVYIVEIREDETKKKAFRRVGVPENDTEVLVICTRTERHSTKAS